MISKWLRLFERSTLSASFLLLAFGVAACAGSSHTAHPARTVTGIEIIGFYNVTGGACDHAGTSPLTCTMQDRSAGAYFGIRAEVLYSDGTKSNAFQAKSNNPNVAFVTGTDTVNTGSNGEAVVTVYATENPTVLANIEVTVNIAGNDRPERHVTGIQITDFYNVTGAACNPAASFPLTCTMDDRTRGSYFGVLAEVHYSDGTRSDAFQARSSNSEVAFVTGTDTVNAGSDGTAVITVYATEQPAALVNIEVTVKISGSYEGPERTVAGIRVVDFYNVTGASCNTVGTTPVSCTMFDRTVGSYFGIVAEVQYTDGSTSTAFQARSSDEEVAFISGTDTVQAGTNGTAEITVFATEMPSATASFIVAVDIVGNEFPDRTVTGIRLTDLYNVTGATCGPLSQTPPTCTMHDRTAGSYFGVNAEVLYSDGSTSQAFRAESSDTRIAFVTGTDTVHAGSNGVAEITVHAAEQPTTFVTLRVVVDIPENDAPERAVTGIQITDFYNVTGGTCDSVGVTPLTCQMNDQTNGAYLGVRAEVLYSDGTRSSAFQVRSNDPEVAFVTGTDTVHAAANGSALITVYATEEPSTLTTFQVNVQFEVDDDDPPSPTPSTAGLVPSATTCTGSTAVGDTCTVTVSITENAEVFQGLHFRIQNSHFSLVSARPIGTANASGCMVLAIESWPEVGMVCDAESGVGVSVGAILQVTFSRTEQGPSVFKTDRVEARLLNGQTVSIHGGSLNVN